MAPAGVFVPIRAFALVIVNATKNILWQRLLLVLLTEMGKLGCNKGNNIVIQWQVRKPLKLSQTVSIYR